ncbi:alpha/beta fold hydrolase [Xanthomonas sp. WHRI 7065]|uniref:thioesterase II family protein n=1 Tax=Xanthomonas sp. WHRI 7065 TaxID=3161569 RepID=UPI0032E9122A
MSKSLLLLTPERSPTVRVLFFPYAGGNASHIRNWGSSFPRNVELLGVRYPRTTGQVARTPQSIAAEVCADVATLANVPLIFLGYSLGALVAYEVGLELSRRCIDAPVHMVAAASRAPHMPRRSPPISELTDAELIEELRRYGGTPEAVLQDKEAIAYLLPFIREDLSVAERYRHAPSHALHCPITAVAGRSDMLAEVADVAAWGEHTQGPFSFHELNGGHFFLHEDAAAVMAIIRPLTERYRCGYGAGPPGPSCARAGDAGFIDPWLLE